MKNSMPMVPRGGGIVARNCVACGSSALDAQSAVLMPFVADRALKWRPVVIDESWKLNSVPFGQALSICNSLGCTSCGLIFLDLRFSDDEMSRLYHDYRGSAYSSLREQYEPGYLARNDSLEKQCPYLDKVENFIAPYLRRDPAILDWGGIQEKTRPFQDLELVLMFSISAIERLFPVHGGSLCRN
jgi:hypothetical protein